MQNTSPFCLLFSRVHQTDAPILTNAFRDRYRVERLNIRPKENNTMALF